MTAHSDRSKAQSEVLGILLLLSLSMVAIGMILVFGQGAVADLQEQNQNERMMNEFALLDSRMATSALATSGEQSVNINLGGGTLTTNSSGTVMNVTYRNDTGPNTEFKIPMGTINYEENDVTLGYEGGGVWRNQGNGSVMVSPPEFHYERQTLTLPVFNITNDRKIAGDRDFFEAESKDTEVLMPNSSLPNINTPLSGGNVTIRVEGSDFYKAWADYFEDRTVGINVETFDSTQTAKMTLPTPETGEIEEAVLGQGTGDELNLEGGYVDSYTNEEHNPAPSHDDGCSNQASFSGGPDNSDAVVASSGGLDSDEMCVYGDLKFDPDGNDINLDQVYVDGDFMVSSTAGNVQLSAGNITGSVESNVPLEELYAEVGGDVNTTFIKDMDSPGEVQGDVRLTADKDPDDLLQCDSSAEINGDLYTRPSISDSPSDYNCLSPSSDVKDLDVANFSIPPVDVEEDKHELGNIPRNDDEFELGEKSLSANGDDCDDIDSGDSFDGLCNISKSGGYYVPNQVGLKGKLIINSEVEMTIEKDTTIADGCILVTDKGELTMHLDGDADLDINQQDVYTTDDVPNPSSDSCPSFSSLTDPHNSTRLTINVHGDSVDMDDSDFTGVIMAPNADSDIQAGTDVYGAVIVDAQSNPDQGHFHFDTALKAQQINTGRSEVYFLHISENKIGVD